ncbi:MAG: dTMP kinase [Chloroflexota bacterium]|nr:dTMP kinase [Anaerolineae bacterium]
MSLLITLEGPDGSGKSTQIQLLYRCLEEQGHSVLLSREPGGTPIGEQIRAVLHDVRNTAMLPNTEILLYSASRAQHVGQVIRPALERGEMVLCDRYAESTMAYQGWGHGLDIELLRTITVFATGGLRPDLIIYLDINVVEGLRRKLDAFESGTAEWNRMDQKAQAFHERVRRGYLMMASQEPEKWLVLDGTRSIADIHQKIVDRVRLLLAGNRRD